MATHVAFIRAVMLGRQGVERELLLDAFVDAGAVAPRSHLATGNVSFDAEEDLIADIAADVEGALLDMAGTEKRVYIRSIPELRALDDQEPFAGIDIEAVHERCVSFLPLDATVELDLPFVSARGDFTLLHAVGNQIFSTTRLVDGRPGALGAWLERRLGIPVTSRNWNTIERVLRIEDG